MLLRHLVAADNVDADGWIIDPQLVHHGVLQAGRVAALAGPIDLATHLNLDFPDHQLGECMVIEQMIVGAALSQTAAGIQRSGPRRAAFMHRGIVQVDERRLAMQQLLKERSHGSAR